MIIIPVKIFCRNLHGNPVNLQSKTPLLNTGRIAKRGVSLGDLYPFKLDKDVLIYCGSESQLYDFLLCASLSPSLTEAPYYNFPRHFERITTEVTANYLGSNSGYCLVGWPNERGQFKNSVARAITASKELTWRPDDGLPDDGLYAFSIYATVRGPIRCVLERFVEFDRAVFQRPFFWSFGASAACRRSECGAPIAAGRQHG